MRYHVALLRIAISKQKRSVGEDVKKLVHIHIVGRNDFGEGIMQKQM
jgi:hypothetical protein